MSEHPNKIQQSVGPTIGVNQVWPGTTDWRLLLMYIAMAAGGFALLAW